MVVQMYIISGIHIFTLSLFLSLSRKGALKMFKKDVFLHIHQDPKLVKNMTGAFELYDKDLCLVREEVEMKAVDEATALETKAYANKLDKKHYRFSWVTASRRLEPKTNNTQKWNNYMTKEEITNKLKSTIK